jgi:PEP-CTERM motif
VKSDRNSSTGQNGNVAAVNASANPSIYEFTWTGGNLTIKEELGNNGIGYNIEVELGLVSAVTLNSNGSLSSSLASISIPYQSGPGAPVDVIDNMFLAAGTYALDTYLGTCANTDECTAGTGSSTDPQYQVLFSPNATATPLPATMPLFATGLGLVGMFGWRRKRKVGAATV